MSPLIRNFDHFLMWRLARPFLFLFVLSLLFQISAGLYFTSGQELFSSLENTSENGVVVILFMFFALTVGIIITQVLSITGEVIPYTCIVFLFGVVFSLRYKDSETFGESISQWVNIDADLVLYIFLPPLIFGEAMGLNWFHIKGALVQSFLLAGPGVVIGAFLMGVVAKLLLPYDWVWNLCLVFGSILAATDTVAVLALLKGANASPKLTILIVGESLLNDGTAIVLFTVFLTALQGERYTFEKIIEFFAKATMGSALLGIAAGLITVRWLRTAHRKLKEIDILAQIAITFCCAYLVFFIAQYSLEISGPLACCFAGLVLAWSAPPIILCHESMHQVWGMVEWTLNTLIFVLSGLITGHRVVQKVDTMDWFYVVVLYVMLVLIRAIIILLLYPWLSTLGHKCTAKECVFMCWAGLRGAIGLMLGLIVEKQAPSDLNRETSRLLFYIVGITTLTLIVNGTTTKRLLVILGLLGSESAEKQLVVNSIKKNLRKKMNELIVKLSKEFQFSSQDLEEVRASCTLLNDADIHTILRDSQIETNGGRGSRYAPPPNANAAGLQREVSLDESIIQPQQQSIRPYSTSSYSTNSTPQLSLAPVDISSALRMGGGHYSPKGYAALRKQFVSIDETSSNSDADRKGSVDHRRYESAEHKAYELQIDHESTGTGEEHLKSVEMVQEQVSLLHGRMGMGLGSVRGMHGVDDSSFDDDEDDVRGDGGYARGHNLSEDTALLDNSHLNSAQSHLSHAARANKRNKPTKKITALSPKNRGRSGSRMFSAEWLNSAADTIFTPQAHLHAQQSSRIEFVSQMLSMSHRGAQSLIIPEVIAFVRSIFLEIVRVKYWNHIEEGRLPRLSHSSKFLLYSIDVGLDDIHNTTENVFGDWRCIDAEISQNRNLIRKMLQWETSILKVCPITSLSMLFATLESRSEKIAVYMLSSFMEAHEHAQKKIQLVLDSMIEDAAEAEQQHQHDESDENGANGDGGGDLMSDLQQLRHAYHVNDFSYIHGHQQQQGAGAAASRKPSATLSRKQLIEGSLSSHRVQPPEVLKVIAESAAAVAKAGVLLKSIPEDVVSAIRSKQAARMILSKEAELVMGMVEEGLLTSENAEAFLEEISYDTAKIERRRNDMYRQQAELRLQQRRFT